MKFSESHEWIAIEEGSDIGIVGITEYAQKELGEIVYVELPEKNKTVAKGAEAAVLESTKAAADVYSPVSGKILDVNQNLKTSPELVNRSPQDMGWIFKIKISDPTQLDQLLDAHAYQSMTSK